MTTILQTLAGTGILIVIIAVLVGITYLIDKYPKTIGKTVGIVIGETLILTLGWLIYQALFDN